MISGRVPIQIRTGASGVGMRSFLGCESRMFCCGPCDASRCSVVAAMRQLTHCRVNVVGRIVLVKQLGGRKYFTKSGSCCELANECDAGACSMLCPCDAAVRRFRTAKSAGIRVGLSGWRRCQVAHTGALALDAAFFTPTFFVCRRARPAGLCRSQRHQHPASQVRWGSDVNSG